MRRELRQRIARRLNPAYNSMLRAVQSSDPVMQEVINNLLYSGGPIPLKQRHPHVA